MSGDAKLIAPSSLASPTAARRADDNGRAGIQTYALTMAIVLGLSLVIRLFGPQPTQMQHPWWWIINLMQMIVYAGFYLMARRGLGRLQLIAGGLHSVALALVCYRAVIDLEAFAPGPSYSFVWLCVLVVTYPLLVRGSSLQHLLLIGLAIVLFPLFEGLLSLRAGRMLAGEEFFGLMITLMLVGVLAGIAAVVVRGLSEHVQALHKQVHELGSYQLKKLLGKGGMGEVWIAEHRLLKRPAAIKLIIPQKLHKAGRDPAYREEMLARFQREAQVTAQLTSPHTVRLFDFGVTNDQTFYYVMELLQGENLEDLVERAGPLPPERAIYLLRQLCESLAEAHAAGLVHRDIKPANVLTCRVGLNYDFVKVLDFGLVIRRQLGDNPGDARLTGKGMVTGTPDFMAPEQALDEELDHRADIYAVGCVAYWLLTRETLFDYPEAIKILNAHVREAPEPVEHRSPHELPAGLIELIHSCLAKHPQERPATIEVVEATLAQLAIDLRWTNENARQWWDAHPKK